MNRILVRTLRTAAIRRAKLVDAFPAGAVTHWDLPKPPVPAPKSESIELERSPSKSTTVPIGGSPKPKVAPTTNVNAPQSLDVAISNALSGLTADQRRSLRSLNELFAQVHERSGKILDRELPNEDAPDSKRQISINVEGPVVPLTTENEAISMVTIAFIVGGRTPTIEYSSGFVIGSPEEDGKVSIVSIAHSIQSIGDKIPIEGSGAFSTALVISTKKSGEVEAFPIDSVLSGSFASDLLILSVSTTPLANKTATTPALPRTFASLPISAYPVPTGTPVAILGFRQAPTKPEDPFNDVYFSEATNVVEKKPEAKGREWKFGRVVEYKDDHDRAIEIGSSDDLHSMTFTQIPTPEVSGSPIIDFHSGAVVGLVRGFTISYGSPHTRGFGTPATSIFNLFRLPGFNVDGTREGAAPPKKSEVESAELEGKKTS